MLFYSKVCCDEKLETQNLGDEFMGELVMSKKPSIEEVLKYAEEQMKYYLRTKASHLPQEQKEEISQDMMLRVWRAYEKLDAEMGWKSFIQNHCFGSTKDYMERGKGFEESKWLLQSKESSCEHSIKFRESGFISEGEDDQGQSDIDKVLAEAVDPNYENYYLVKERIDWDLLARLCSVDKDLHIFVRYHLLDHTLESLTTYFGLTRERIGQRLIDFTNSLDDPDQYENTWIAQIIYALGLCEEFHMPNVDQGHGWHLPPVDFTVLEKRFDKQEDVQTSFELGGESENPDKNGLPQDV